MDSGAEADMPEDFAFDVVFIRILPLARITIRCGEKQQELPPLLQSHATELCGACRRAEKGLHRGLEADSLFKCCLSKSSWICPHLGPLIRIPGQGVQCCTDSIDGGVHSCGQHRTNKLVCFVLGDLTRIRTLIEDHAEPVGLQMLTQSLGLHPGKHFLCSRCRDLKQRVCWPERVENHVPVRQQV